MAEKEYIEREAARPDAFCEGVSCQECPFCKDPIKGGCRVDDFIKAIPAADVVEVVRCGACCYAPSGTDKGKELGLGLEWPERMTNQCPLMCEDGWYSHKPEPDWFCANGKRKDGGLEPPKEETCTTR